MVLTVDNINDLSKRQAALDFQYLLRDRRVNGFQRFILSLRKEPDAQGNGWTFSKGLLTVKDPHNSEEIMDFLESKLQHHPWFQTRADLDALRQEGAIIEELQLPIGFESYTQSFKCLGSWGKNPAMDVGVFILNEDSSLSIQVITRPHDKKYAFLGGMIDKDLHTQKTEIIKKCQQEFLEEFYSKDLFAQKSKTLQHGSNIDSSILAVTMQEILNDNEFVKLNTILPQLLGIFNQNGLSFNMKIVELEKKLKQLGIEQKIRIEDLDVLLVRLKCRMYQGLFTEQYMQMCDFLAQNLVQMPETINESDPRNTKTAFMTTTPHYFFINKEKLKLMQKNWFVEAKGGDDAESVKIVPVECLFDKPMFSAHARILLDMLANRARQDPNFLNNNVLQQQLNIIKVKIVKREISELKLVPNQQLETLQVSSVLQPDVSKINARARINI